MCVCVCVSLLRTFITLSTLQNPFDKHIAYFKNLAWATSLANQASRKDPTGQVGKKVDCHTLYMNQRLITTVDQQNWVKMMAKVV